MREMQTLNVTMKEKNKDKKNRLNVLNIIKALGVDHWIKFHSNHTALFIQVFILF